MDDNNKATCPIGGDHSQHEHAQQQEEEGHGHGHGHAHGHDKKHDKKHHEKGHKDDDDEEHEKDSKNVVTPKIINVDLPEVYPEVILSLTESASSWLRKPARVPATFATHLACLIKGHNCSQRPAIDVIPEESGENMESDDAEESWQISGAYAFPETSRLFQLAWLAYCEMKTSERFETKQVQIASVDLIKSTNDDNYFPNTPNFARRFAATVKLCMAVACGITDAPNPSAPFSCPATAAGVRLYRHPDGGEAMFKLGGGDEAEGEKYLAVFEQMFPLSFIERELKTRKQGSMAMAGKDGSNKLAIMPRRMLIFRSKDVIEIKTTATLRDPASSSATSTTSGITGETSSTTTVPLSRDGVYNCAVNVSCKRSEILQEACTNCSPGVAYRETLSNTTFGPYFQHLKAICWKGELKLNCMKVSQAFPSDLREEGMQVQSDDEPVTEEQNVLVVMRHQQRDMQVLRREMELFKQDQACTTGNITLNALALRDAIEEIKEEILELRNEHALTRDDILEVKNDQEKILQSKVCCIL